MTQQAIAGPQLAAVRSVIERACRAPSIHNSQPWRWEMGRGWLQLYADRSRSVPVTDPSRRDLLISCGAVLHHARVAFAAAGWATDVERLPDPAHPDHLASIGFRSAQPEPEDELLDAMIIRRRTDRRRFSSWQVPPGVLRNLSDRATDQGAIMVSVLDPRLRSELTRAIAEAALRQETDSEYNRELASWAGRADAVSQGVPAGNLPAGRRQYGDTLMRSFPGGWLPAEEGPEHDAGELAVIATSSDDRLSQLRAGEAMSAVLLSATSMNLATCPLSQAMEIGYTRRTIAERVLRGTGTPQMILRFGWSPISNPELPPTPRRNIDEVLSFR